MEERPLKIHDTSSLQFPAWEGRQATLWLFGIIFDEARTRVLLTRRADNGLWCAPGGAMEPGESAAEACEREVFEETGLTVRVKRLVGVYSNPDQLVIYPDGTKVQIVAMSFEGKVISGEFGLSNETTGFDYFTLNEIEPMNFLGTPAKFMMHGGVVKLHLYGRNIPYFPFELHHQPL